VQNQVSLLRSGVAWLNPLHLMISSNWPLTSAVSLQPSFKTSSLGPGPTFNMFLGPFDRRKQRHRCDACTKSHLKVRAIPFGPGQFRI
jgi:hypothetical protein